MFLAFVAQIPDMNDGARQIIIPNRNSWTIPIDTGIRIITGRVN